MLRMICEMPDFIGWAIVGVLSATTLYWLGKLGMLFVEMWYNRH